MKKQTGGNKNFDNTKITRHKRDKDGKISRYKAVTRGYVTDEDVDSKRVEKKTRRGLTIKEKSTALIGAGETYGLQDNDSGKPKKLWKRRFKSKTDKEGNEKKRKEKIVYDDGQQMKKRKQRRVRFGKNKGKIKSKTVHWNRGKRTVKKEYLDKTDTSKLQTGGFLESPIARLFED